MSAYARPPGPPPAAGRRPILLDFQPIPPISQHVMALFLSMASRLTRFRVESDALALPSMHHRRLARRYVRDGLLFRGVLAAMMHDDQSPGPPRDAEPFTLWEQSQHPAARRVLGVSSSFRP